MKAAALELLAKASTLLREGRPEHAVAQFEQAVGIWPMVEGWIGMSQAWAELGRLDKAWEAAERARQLGPAEGCCFRWLARLARLAGQREEAAGYLETAVMLEQDPEIAESWRELAKLRWEQGLLLHALDALGRAEQHACGDEELAALRREWQVRLSAN